MVRFALNSWQRESVKHETFKFHPGSQNRDEIMVTFPELKTFN